LTIAGVMSFELAVQHAMGFMPGLRFRGPVALGGINALAGALRLVEGQLPYRTDRVSRALVTSASLPGCGPGNYTDIFAFIVLAVVLQRPSGLLLGGADGRPRPRLRRHHMIPKPAS
jgi:branched-subunit amino acid ABC-type transport system permease component